MAPHISPQHPLRRLFGALTEKSFTEHLGWPDHNVTKYLSNLLVDFVHTDQLHKIKNSRNQPVDMVVDLGNGNWHPEPYNVAANPYNYSDMTGDLLFGVTAQQGTWQVVHDSGTANTAWANVRWNQEPAGSEPPGTSIRPSDATALGESGVGHITNEPPSMEISRG